jgi:hypothetical protein
MTIRFSTAVHALALVLAGAAPAAAQVVIANSSFEGGSTAGWTLGGATPVRVGALQAVHLIGGAIPGGIPDGTWFIALSTTPSQAGTGGTTARIDANTTNEFDIATLSTTVEIPFWPAALEFDWTFPSSEQDQPGQFDDLFDVMVYQGTPPADPTIDDRLFARSAPRNVPQDFSNFTNAHFLDTATVNWTLNRPGSNLNGTSLRYGVAEFRRACVGIDLPEFPGPPYTRTIRFRIADQGDRQFDSALFLDRIQVVRRCNPAGQLAIVQRTSTAGSEVRLKNGGVQFRPVQGRRLALDPTGRVQAVASNANLDGTNPSFVEQVFIKVDEGGWQRVGGLAINDGGEVQGLALSGTVGSTPGRYLAIAARTTEAGNVEVYRWDRQLSTLATLSSTAANVCENANPSINFAGTVIAYESTCNAITGAGSTRRLKVWTGGAVNSGGAIQGAIAGACTGRSPALHGEAAAGSGMIAFESNCAHVGSNADGNTEIYRYRWTTSAVTGGTFVRVTTTAGTVFNGSPQMDRSANGDVFFLSSLDRGGLHVFQYDCGAVACGTANTLRWTDGPATQTYLSLRKLVNPANTTESQDFVFERLNLASGTTEIGHRIGPTGQENVITIANPVINLAGGLNGTVPVFGFLSNEDLLVGQNADGNREAFSVRVELP